MVATTTTTDDGTTTAEVQTAVLSDHLRRISRTEPNPTKAAVFAAAASSLKATQERLTADLALITGRPRPAEVVDLSSVTVGQLQVDRGSRVVMIDNEPVRLTRTQYSLLVIFISEPSRVFRKDELYRGVWGRDLSFDTETRIVDAHIARLRKALGGPPWLHNVWGVGYSLLPPAPGLPQVAA